MVINPISIVILIIVLITSYFLFGVEFLPLTVVLWFLNIFLKNKLKDYDDITSKVEKKIYSSENVKRNIQELENGDYIGKKEEKEIVKEVLEKYKKNLKYIEEKKDKILIYPNKEFVFVDKIWGIDINKLGIKSTSGIWGIGEYVPSYKNKRPILEISMDGITYSGNYFFDWNNISGFKKHKGLLSNKSSYEALEIKGSYIYKQDDIKEIKGKSGINKATENMFLRKGNLIYYELMFLPQTINIIIGIIENYIRKNHIRLGVNLK
ncbi:hypothetical protein CSA08_03380 [Candidatus Gracilibacteria bacterium]|nr:MAG: hypothetical protein CSA08_03380 [Candidatus Gracilibacteria bacterium]